MFWDFLPMAKNPLEFDYQFQYSERWHTASSCYENKYLWEEKEPPNKSLPINFDFPFITCGERRLMMQNHIVVKTQRPCTAQQYYLIEKWAKNSQEKSEHHGV